MFSFPIPLLGERARWGDHVFFTYKQRLSTNDQRIAMAVGGLEAMETKHLLSFVTWLKRFSQTWKILDDLEFRQYKSTDARPSVRYWGKGIQLSGWLTKCLSPRPDQARLNSEDCARLRTKSAGLGPLVWGGVTDNKFLEPVRCNHRIQSTGIV